MKTRTVASVIGVAAFALLLTGCVGNSQAQAAYDACSDGDDYGIMRLDGSSIVVELKGDNAKAASSLDDDIDDVLSGDDVDKQDEGPSSLAVALTLIGDIDCLTEQTAYPGSSDDLRNGEEWDGWRYSYEKGAGSEESYRFTAR